MQNPLSAVAEASGMTLKGNKRKAGFIVVIGLTCWLFIAIPVYLTPGNDFAFQLSIMLPRDFFLFSILAVLNSLLVMMQWHIRSLRQNVNIGSVVAGGTGSLSAVFASILSTASCSACVAGLLGFLGTGGVLFILDYRWHISIIALVIAITAIVLAAKRIVGICQSCTNITHRKPHVHS